MKVRYILFAIVALVSALSQPGGQADPVLFIGAPTGCLSDIHGDCSEGQELLVLLAEQEYKWIVVLETEQDLQELAVLLLKTQPQAEIVFMTHPELAAKFRLRYEPDSSAVLQMLEKDRDNGWKNVY